MSIRLKIFASSLGFVAIVVVLGGFAQLHAAQLGRLAVDIYDHSFVGLSYVAQAREAFLYAAEGQHGLSTTRTEPPAHEAMEKVLERLEIAIGRAATDRTRDEARRTMALLVDLTHAPPEALADRLAKADQAIAKLVKDFSGDGLTTRDQAEELEAENFHQLLGETAIAIGLALSMGLLLSRNLSRPLVQLFQAIELLASGNLEQQLAPELVRRRDEIGSVASATMVFREAMRRNAQASEDQFRSAVSNMSQGLCMFDTAEKLVVANAKFAEILGLRSSDLSRGATIEAVLASAASAFSLKKTDIEMMYDNIRIWRSGGASCGHTWELASGQALAVNYVPVAGGGWLATLEDITWRRLAEAKVAYMALHDALTGLPNRVLFHEKLSEAVARSRRGEAGAVLCLDLDHFKAVNDTLGHPVGDALLRAVTKRLRQEVRETDTVARLGGDEFAIIQSSIDQPEDATALARRVIETISLPYEFDGNQVIIGASVGIATIPGDGDNPDELMKNADMALYGAKADGRGCYRFFEPAMDALMRARRTLELDLRNALVAGEFKMYYQPLMSIESRSVSGFEALLRWQHPERGMVPPSEFIPLAEEIGLIVPLGKWALNQACVDAASWADGIRVAVNVSGVQLGCITFVADVADALATSGLAPNRLELEITETVLIEDTEAVLVVLRKLRALGVGIAMDDFGTGYSSLSYLRRFPFSKVKIDQSFIRGLGSDGDSAAIVNAVTDLCKTLGMTTLAEGVETEEQFNQLMGGNCNEAQGYLFGKACPAAEVAATFKRLARSETV